MLQIFIAFIVMAIVCLLIARIKKDSRVYTQLMLGVCLGFIVGASVKHSIATESNNQQQEITAHPMVQSPISSVVGNDTVTLSEPSKDLNESDTVIPTVSLPTSPQTNEIQDDS